MASPRVLRIPIVTAAFVALLTGCAQSVDPWVASQRDGEVRQVPEPSEEDHGGLTGRQVVDQLPSALKNFDGSFPDADHTAILAKLKEGFSAELRNTASDGPPGSVHFQEGYAESIVLGYWMCSWERVYVESLERDDAAGVARADAQLATWYDLEYSKKWVEDPERGWERDVLQPARRGETRAIIDDYKLSCGQ